jgi:predicted PurR-regulated permease PerM
VQDPSSGERHDPAAAGRTEPVGVPASRLWLWRVWTAIGILVLLAAAWWLLREPLAIVGAPLALAAIIVYLLNPVVGGLKRRGLPRALGTAVAYVVVTAGLVALVTAVGPVIASQVGELLERLPEISESLQATVNGQLARMGIEERVTVDLQSDQTRASIERFLDDNRDTLLDVLRGAGIVLGRVLHGLLTIVLAPILAFYLLADLPRILEGVQRLFPPGPRAEVVEVAARIGRAVGGYFRGQLLVATFVGVATAAGLALIGLPLWALVGLAAGLFNLVPLVGPFVGGLIGVVVALTVGDGGGQAVLVVVVMTVVQQVDNHLVTPNIVARTVKVHPMTVILGLLVAGTLYGLVGMFVVIPVIAAIKLAVMYVLVTRVPSMRHLAGEEPALFGPEDALPEVREGTLVALGRDLRRAWERRRPREDGRGSGHRRDPGAGHGQERLDRTRPR